ncbi:MAG TPA: DegV family protein, partial [Terriglobales bacterium]|nr:DegV family protein [Terriglobales bacterium]
MKWNLVSDSSCDLAPEEFTGENFTFSTAPLTVTAGGKDFVDLPGTDVDAMLAAHSASKLPSSSTCPSPEM